MMSDPISSLLVQKIEEKMGIFKNSGYFLWGESVKVFLQSR
jgi:hypothetical protein